MSDALDTIERLRERYEDTDPDEAQRLKLTEETVKRAMLTKDLGEHAAILMLRDTLQKKVQLCNDLLSNDEEMSLDTRGKVFARKSVYAWFLRLFEVADAKLKVVGRRVKKQSEAEES